MIERPYHGLIHSNVFCQFVKNNDSTTYMFYELIIVYKYVPITFNYTANLFYNIIYTFIYNFKIVDD